MLERCLAAYLFRAAHVTAHTTTDMSLFCLGTVENLRLAQRCSRFLKLIAPSYAGHYAQVMADAADVVHLQFYSIA